MTTDRQFRLGFPRRRVAWGSLWFLIVTVIICWQSFISVSKFITMSWNFFLLCFHAVMSPVKWSEWRNRATVGQWAHDIFYGEDLGRFWSKSSLCSHKYFFLGLFYKRCLSHIQFPCCTVSPTTDTWNTISDQQQHFLYLKKGVSVILFITYLEDSVLVSELRNRRSASSWRLPVERMVFLQVTFFRGPGKTTLWGHRVAAVVLPDDHWETVKTKTTNSIKVIAKQKLRWNVIQ